MRRYLNEKSLQMLVLALVISRLDYANSLLAGAPVTQIHRLQLLQNNAARIVCGVRRFDSVTQSLISLHWLPVLKRIEFKVCCIVYKALEGSAPSYIRDLIDFHSTGRTLRSSTSGTLLKVPRTRSNYGDRAFSSIGPRLWNELPDSLRDTPSLVDFRRKLKTLLFTRAYYVDC